MHEWFPLLLAFQLGIGPGAEGPPALVLTPPAPAPPAMMLPDMEESRPPADTTAYPDDWFGEDKLRHFFLSFAVTSLVYGAARTVGLDEGPSAIVAGVGAAAAGVWKEFHDRSIGRPFSVKDLVWDGLGIAAGLVLATQAR